MKISRHFRLTECLQKNCQANFAIYSICCSYHLKIIMSECIICKDSLCDSVDTVKLTEKGILGIQNASLARGDDLLTQVHAGDIVHVSCRKRYVNLKYVNSNVCPSGSLKHTPLLRSSLTFSFKSDCLFCTLPVDIRGKESFSVRTDTFQKSI